MDSAALTCDADVVSEDEPAGGGHEAAHHHSEGDLAAVAVAGARPAAAAHREYHSPAVHLCSPPLCKLWSTEIDGSIGLELRLGARKASFSPSRARGELSHKQANAWWYVG